MIATITKTLSKKREIHDGKYSSNTGNAAPRGAEKGERTEAQGTRKKKASQKFISIYHSICFYAYRELGIGR